jgi:hypothetical protein
MLQVNRVQYRAIQLMNGGYDGYQRGVYVLIPKVGNKIKSALLIILLVSLLDYSSRKSKTTDSSETTGSIQSTQHYNLEDSSHSSPWGPQIQYWIKDKVAGSIPGEVNF